MSATRIDGRRGSRSDALASEPSACDVGEPIIVRRHDRQAIGGPIGLLLLAGFICWLSVSMGHTAFKLVAISLLAGAILLLLVEVGKWKDQLALHAHGITQIRRRRKVAFCFDSIERLEYSAARRGALGAGLIPFPFGLLFLCLGSAFRLSVHPKPGCGKSIHISGTYKRRGDEINSLIAKLQRRVADAQLASVKQDEPVIWTRRLLIMPDGLALLKRPLRPSSTPGIKRFVAYGDIRTAEIRDGHLLVKVHGRRRCAVKSRVAGKSPAGWIVFRRLLQEPSRSAPTVGFCASPPAVLPP